MLSIVVMQDFYMYDPLMRQISVVDMVHSIMQDIKSRCRIGRDCQFRWSWIGSTLVVQIWSLQTSVVVSRPS